MHSLQLNSEEIISSLESMMQQPYIEKYIKKPFIDPDKILLLTDIFQQMKLPLNEVKQMIIPVMLVQCALDTHEQIPAESGQGMSETEKQLSVLAGDYYSGLYYSQLSSNGHLDMIRILASAIKEINESKMHLYYKESHEFTELIYFLTKIESSLITSVAGTNHLNSLYIQVAEKVCLLKRLIIEKNMAERGKDSYLTTYFKGSYQHAQPVQLIQLIEQEMEKQKAQLDHLLSLLPSTYNSIRETVRERFSLIYNTTFAEEG